MRKNGARAGHGGDRRSKSNDTTLKTLDELGITRDESSRWQQLADIPEEQFAAGSYRQQNACMKKLEKWAITTERLRGLYHNNL